MTDVWAGFVLFYAGGIPVAAILGFLVAQALVLVGAGYWAYLQCVGGYFLLFGTLIHGWDGSGYERFLSPGARDFAGWPKDSVVNHVLDFVTSGTFLALLLFGAAVIGTMLVTEIGWLMEGWSLPGADEDRKVPRLLGIAIAAAGVYGLPFVGALFASVLVRLVGGWLGIPLFAALAGVVLLHGRSPVRWLYGLVGVPGRHWRAGLDAQESGRSQQTGLGDEHREDDDEGPAGEVLEDLRRVVLGAAGAGGRADCGGGGRGHVCLTDVRLAGRSPTRSSAVTPPAGPLPPCHRIASSRERRWSRHNSDVVPRV